MKKIDVKVWNRLIYNSGEIVAGLPSSKAGFKRWVAIYPAPNRHYLVKRGNYKFSILDFELEESLINKYFAEDDKKNQKRFFIKDEKELYEQLERIGVNPKLFNYPWNTGYPL